MEKETHLISRQVRKDLSL